jgi:hypothetical protein
LQKAQKPEIKASIDEFEAKLNGSRQKGVEGETAEETDSPAPVVPAKRTKQSRSSMKGYLVIDLSVFVHKLTYI